MLDIFSTHVYLRPLLSTLLGYVGWWQVTKVKYIHTIQIGKFEIDAWFVWLNLKYNAIHKLRLIRNVLGFGDNITLLSRSVMVDVEKNPILRHFGSNVERERKV